MVAQTAGAATAFAPARGHRSNNGACNNRARVCNQWELSVALRRGAKPRTPRPNPSSLSALVSGEGSAVLMSTRRNLPYTGNARALQGRDGHGLQCCWAAADPMPAAFVSYLRAP